MGRVIPAPRVVRFHMLMISKLFHVCRSRNNSLPDRQTIVDQGPQIRLIMRTSLLQEALCKLALFRIGLRDKLLDLWGEGKDFGLVARFLYWVLLRKASVPFLAWTRGFFNRNAPVSLEFIKAVIWHAVELSRVRTVLR